MVITYCICGTATLPEDPSSSTGFNWVLVIKSLVFCVLYCRSLFSFVLFMCAHVFPVRLQYTVFDYPYGIFNFFVYGRITTVYILIGQLFVPFFYQMYIEDIDDNVTILQRMFNNIYIYKPIKEPSWW